MKPDPILSYPLMRVTPTAEGPAVLLKAENGETIALTSAACRELAAYALALNANRPTATTPVTSSLLRQHPLGQWYTEGRLTGGPFEAWISMDTDILLLLADEIDAAPKHVDVLA